jgi:hypothetical protein
MVLRKSAFHVLSTGNTGRSMHERERHMSHVRRGDDCDHDSISVYFFFSMHVVGYNHIAARTARPETPMTVVALYRPSSGRRAKEG